MPFFPYCLSASYLEHLLPHLSLLSRYFFSILWIPVLIRWTEFTQMNIISHFWETLTILSMVGWNTDTQRKDFRSQKVQQQQQTVLWGHWMVSLKSSTQTVIYCSFSWLRTISEYIGQFNVLSLTYRQSQQILSFKAILKVE